MRNVLGGCVALWMVACASGSKDSSDADGGLPDGGLPDGGGSTTETTPAFASSVQVNVHNPFAALVDFSLDEAASVRVEYGEGAFTHQTPSLEVEAGVSAQIQVLGLRAGRDFQLQAVAIVGGEEARGELLSFSTEPLPDTWPTCSPWFTLPEAQFDADEVLCTQGLTTDQQRFYFCTDYWGETVFSIAAADNDLLMSVTPLQSGGWASTSGISSSLYLFDELGATTDKLLSSYFRDRTRFGHEFIVSHGVIQIESGIWSGAIVILTLSVEFLTESEFKMGNGLIVYDPVTDEVLYDYHLNGPRDDGVSGDPLVSFDREGSGDNESDWTHANSLAHGQDADGREYLLLSLKAQDWIVKLYPDADEIAWILGREGDFTLVDDIEAADPIELSPLEWAYHQHGILPVGSDDGYLHLLMLDNGLPRHDGVDYVYEDAYSRAIQYRIDEERRLVDIVFEYGESDRSSSEYFLTEICGNVVLTEEADRLLVLDGDTATRIELNYPDGRERWRMQCDPIELCEYRLEWYPSLYERDWYYR